MDYSLILPCYNEEKLLDKTLKLLSSISELTQIIVINDGSTDTTDEILSKYRNINVVTNKRNYGKTESVIKGIAQAKYKNIILYDADLLNMRKEYILSMIKLYESGFDMVIMNKDGQPYFFREILKSLPAQSGTRVFSRSEWNKINFKSKKGFVLEPYINRHYLNNKLKIGFVKAPKVYDPRKFLKYPFLIGLYLDLKSAINILGALGWINVIENFRIMKKIHSMNRNSESQSSVYNI